MAEDSRRLFNGRYRLRTPLGEGGVGIVSRAWDQVLERDVVPKCIGRKP